LPTTGRKDPEREYRYSSTLSLTSALHGGGWLTGRPGRFTPGKETRYPLYRRLGGPESRSGWVRKILFPPEFIFCALSVSLFPYCPGFAFGLYCTTHATQTFMPLVVFEPAIPASDRLQTLALERSASGIGKIRSPDPPARDESLCRLRHPGQHTSKYTSKGKGFPLQA
jgi:hypothetical protein